MNENLIMLNHFIKLRTTTQVRLYIYLHQNLLNIEFIDHLTLMFAQIQLFHQMRNFN